VARADDLRCFCSPRPVLQAFPRPFLIDTGADSPCLCPDNDAAFIGEEPEHIVLKNNGVDCRAWFCVFRFDGKNAGPIYCFPSCTITNDSCRPRTHSQMTQAHWNPSSPCQLCAPTSHNRLATHARSVPCRSATWYSTVTFDPYSSPDPPLQ
jgi:hypothetical protein